MKIDEKACRGIGNIGEAGTAWRIDKKTAFDTPPPKPTLTIKGKFAIYTGDSKNLERFQRAILQFTTCLGESHTSG
jgi:hypothetical protein